MFCYIALVISWKLNMFSNLIWIWIQRVLIKMIPLTGWVCQEVKLFDWCLWVYQNSYGRQNPEKKIQPGRGKSEVCSFSTHCPSNIQCLCGHFCFHKMSTFFRTSFQASTVKGGWMRGDWARCLAECHGLMTRVHVRVTSRSIAFLQTKGILRLEHWRFMIKTS